MTFGDFIVTIETKDDTEDSYRIVVTRADRTVLIDPGLWTYLKHTEWDFHYDGRPVFSQDLLSIGTDGYGVDRVTYIRTGWHFDDRMSLMSLIVLERVDDVPTA